MTQDLSSVFEGPPKDLELGKVAENVLEITRKMKYEIMRCVACPILRECSHPRKRLESLRAEAEQAGTDVYEEEIDLDNSKENQLRAARRKTQIIDAYIREHAHRILRDERCVFEKRDILSILQRFTDAGYDLSDPRAYIIVNELLSNLLQIGRTNKAFTNMGIVMRRETPAGIAQFVNPLMRYRTEQSKMIIEAVEALDRIMKSDKTKDSDVDFTKHILHRMKTKLQTAIDAPNEVFKD
jgi:hypothetical protein